MARFKVSTAAGVSGLTTLDLSTGTESGTGLKGAGTDLSAGTIVVAAAHGNMDSGLDPWVNLQEIVGGRPAGKLILHLRMQVTTPPTEDPGSGHCYLGCFAAPSLTLTSTQGYFNSLVKKSTNTHHIGRPKRPGTATTINSVYTGAGETHLFVAFDGTTAAAGFGVGIGASSGYDEGSETTNSGGTWSSVYVGFYAAQTHATPASIVTWTGVTVAYEWL